MLNDFVNIKWVCSSYEEFEWMYDHISKFNIDRSGCQKEDMQFIIDDVIKNSTLPILMLEKDHDGVNWIIKLTYCMTTENKATCEGCAGHPCKDYPFKSVKLYKRELKLKRINE